MLQKIDKILAVAFALGSLISLAGGLILAINLAHPAPFIAGFFLFLMMVGFAINIDPTI